MQRVGTARGLAKLARMKREDVVAALIGAEGGAAVGLLVFGGIPMLPLGITLGGAAAGPLLLRAGRPLRRLLFRHWLRTQLRAGG
jgi:hypothetical protein